MFNGKRIERLEKELLTDSEWWSVPRNPMKDRVEELEQKTQDLEEVVNGKKERAVYNPFGIVWPSGFTKPEVGMKDDIQNLKQEIAKLKELVREVTDFVYREKETGGESEK